MTRWQLQYWNAGRAKGPVEKWLDKLNKEQLKSIAKEMAILEAVGNELKLPHSKALGRGLFELRERRYGYRMYYGFQGVYIIVLLAAGDKQTQTNDITVARNRLSKLDKE